MADYNIPEYVDRRLRYYDGLKLTDQDFIDEQKYYINRQRLASKNLTVAGICEGLTVTGSPGGSEITVSAGMAIDNEGRMIVLTEDTEIPLSKQDGKHYVTIAYKEKPDGLKDRYWLEEPAIALRHQGTEVIQLNALVMAVVNIEKEKLVNIDIDKAQISGINLPTVGQNMQSVSLKNSVTSNRPMMELYGKLKVTAEVEHPDDIIASFETVNQKRIEFAYNRIQMNAQDEGLTIYAVQSQEREPIANFESVNHNAYTTITNRGIGTNSRTVGETVDLELRPLKDGAVLIWPNGVESPNDTDIDHTRLTVYGKLEANSMEGMGCAVPGMIVMWYGETIPRGWHICNGMHNGVANAKIPNLTDRFILATSNSGMARDERVRESGSQSVSVAAVLPSHSHQMEIDAIENDGMTPLYAWQGKKPTSGPIAYGTKDSKCYYWKAVREDENYIESIDGGPFDPQDDWKIKISPERLYSERDMSGTQYWNQMSSRRKVLKTGEESASIKVPMTPKAYKLLFLIYLPDLE